ncbi:hypothetical protein [Rhizobium mongolense]|uniref:hypothetical protein n=1 Tax=Rhizobium mongolense TaxID=57676 RepID=UPI0034A2CC72
MANNLSHSRIIFILGTLPSITQARPDVQWIFQCFAKFLYPRKNLVHSAEQFPRLQVFRGLVLLDPTRAYGKSYPVRPLSVRAFWIRVEDKLDRPILQLG